MREYKSRILLRVNCDVAQRDRQCYVVETTSRDLKLPRHRRRFRVRCTAEHDLDGRMGFEGLIKTNTRESR